MPIDRDAAEPLYQQLAAILRDQIRSGEITSRVPSLTELQEAYGVSDPTARAAIGVLEAEGLVRTQPGRGTFVVREQA